ncbi:MAG: prepilin peptidase [Chloroflexi bacterium]|nr:prepilin peptidase [Chloroflexota bacterium]
MCGVEIALIIVFALLGSAVGSFLNVCIDRLPAGKSLAYPSSHCDICQHRLSPKDLVPVFSYLWLRGRCHYCQTPIPRRILWVEIGTGLLFALAFWRFGLTPQFAVTAFYISIFVVLGIIDLEHRLILNKIIYPMSIIALIISILPISRNIDIPLPWPTAVNGVIGGAIGFGFLLIPALISRGGMGWGDIKLAALIGLITGFPLIFVSLLLGIIAGGAVAGILLLLKIKSKKEAIPFGPFLSAAAIATLFWGNTILNWYLGI